MFPLFYGRHICLVGQQHGVSIKKKMLHNSSGMKNCTGQILGEVVHKAIIYHISDS